MRDLQQHVAGYVAELNGPGAESAWHSLVGVGPDALPHILEAFNAVGEPAVQVALVEIASEYRSAAAVPFLEAALQNGHAPIWKAALDGLVSIGGNAALQVLTVARATAIGEKREWIDEAIGQIWEATRPTNEEP